MTDLQQAWAWVYGYFDGKLNRANCADYCKGPHHCCRPGQALVLLPGEGEYLQSRHVEGIEGDRWVCPGHDGCLRSLKPMCCRTFPVHPTAEGRFLIRSSCSHHRWASHRFLNNAIAVWSKLWEHEAILDWVRVQRETGLYSHWTDEIDLGEIKRGFGTEYAHVFGRYYNAELTVDIVTSGWLKPGDKVLDAGSGSGVRVQDLRKQGIWTWGIDINPTFEVEHCDTGDVRKLPYRDGYFDAVMSIDVLEHLPDYDKALAEMARVCRDRLIVAVTTTETPWNLYEDPTHCIEMSFGEWLGVFANYGEIVHKVAPYWCVTRKGE